MSNSGYSAPNDLRIEWLTRIGEIEALEPQWRALEESAQDRTVFSTFDWIVAWYHHYAGERGNPLVGVARTAEGVLGVAPLVLWNGRLAGVPVRRVDFAGHNSEAGEFLLANDRPELAGHLLQSLLKRGGFDFVCLNHMDTGSRRFSAMEQALSATRCRFERVPTRDAVVDIQHGFEAYSQGFTSNFRRNLKRREKKMSGLGHWKIERFSSVTEAALGSFVERSFDIFDASWKARVGGPLGSSHRGFYREVAERFARRGMLDLSILSVGGKDAAFIMALVERGGYYDCSISFTEAFDNLSPGTFLIVEVLKLLPQQGVHTVVSHGDHEYKRFWASAFVNDTRAFIFRPSPRAQISRLMRFKVLPLFSRGKRDAERGQNG